MPGGQQQSQTGDTDTTHMQRQQTDFQARADAAASVPNPMYASGAGTTPVQQPQTYWQSIADAAASIPNALYVSRADRTYPGEASGRCALCSFIRSRLTYIATVIAVLLSLIAVGLALLAFINNEETSELTSTVDALKRDQDDMPTTLDDMRQLSPTVDTLEPDQDNMRQLSTTVDALKRDQDDMRQLSTTVDALERNQDNMRQLSATVDTLRRDQDNMRQLSTSVHALKCDQDGMRQLFTAVDTLKRDRDNMSTSVQALKCDQDDMRQLSATVDALKRDQDDMRQLSATVDALKRDQDDMRQLSTTLDALERDQDHMSTTVDALKRDHDDMRQLSTTIDALKRDQDHIRQLSTTIDALKRDQDDMSTTLDALKRNQDDMRQLSTTVDALKRDHDDMRQLSTTVDALKRDQDDMRQLSTTVDALKRDQDDMRQLSVTVDTLKRDLDKERGRTAALEQRLHEMRKSPASCPEGYAEFRGICYKASDTQKTFSGATAACGEKGGTLAMPRDAETNAFLISLHNAVSYSGHFWFGLHDRREEGSFEWVDGSALGTYNNWAPGEPNNGHRGNQDCVLYAAYLKDKWADFPCDWPYRFICQAVPDKRQMWSYVIRLIKVVSELSTTVDVLKQDRDEMRQLSATVDALRRDQDNMSTTVDALKRVQDHMHQLSATVDALKRDQDDMSTTVDALKRDQDDMSTTVDALKLGLDKERSRITALEQRLHEMRKTPGTTSCPEGYAVFRGICYKAFNTLKTFSDAAAVCGEDGGTLAMPRDAGTNAFLISLYKSDVRKAELSPPLSGDSLTIRSKTDQQNVKPVIIATYINLTSRTMPGGQQQSQTGDTGTTPMQQDQGASSGTYVQAERVYYTIKDEDLPPSLHGVGRQQGGSRGRVRHGNGDDKPQEEQEASSHTYEEADMKRHATYTSADRTYPGGASCLGALYSFICSHRSSMAAGTVVLLSLVAVGLAPLTFINREEIAQLSTTVDSLKRGQDNMSTTVDALKRGQDDMHQQSTDVDAVKRDQDDMRQLSTTVDALKRDQDDMRQLSTTVDALKRDQDDMRQLSTTVDALKREQDDMRQLSTTVDALKRDQDDMRQLFSIIDALKRDQDDMSTTLDALKRDLDSERSRTAALEQRLDAMSNTKSPASCPKGYAVFRRICYKAFNTQKTFSGAASACGEDGGTLAMPRDAETDAFLIFLRKPVSDGETYWIGLHDQREEGSFEWVDGSALGMYNNWGPGEPNNSGGKEDCISYFTHWTGIWNDARCDSSLHYICQVFPRNFL
uniref:C-type lectin domain-containing protein n=1 Tax=Branchiostoma floridae TaxID=7739 RepID=C3ZR52_BRAFL|eukprot:XP_002588914.1 hypothetical protein BRAFLDRAFT_89102 [Branchiostoma floridae]